MASNPLTIESVHSLSETELSPLDEAQRILAALTASPYQRAVDAHSRQPRRSRACARKRRSPTQQGRNGRGRRLQQVELDPVTMPGGKPPTAIVMLTGNAPPGGAVVSLPGSSPDVQVPATVTVPDGSPPPYVNVSTSEVTANTTATVTATYHDASVSSKLTLTAQQAPASVASVPPFITIGQDGANGGFSIATSQVSAQTAVTISATGAG